MSNATEMEWRSEVGVIPLELIKAFVADSDGSGMLGWQGQRFARAVLAKAATTSPAMMLRN